MAPESPDWTVPVPLRALLWWPPIAFVVAMVDPSAAAITIAVAGAALAVAGVLVPVVGRALARRLTRAAAATAEQAPTGLGMAATELAPVPAEQPAA